MISSDCMSNSINPYETPKINTEEPLVEDTLVPSSEGMVDTKKIAVFSKAMLGV